jgi:acetylornithine deacetylase/succinyl-diaminopimelate desuccinylase-like protein
LVFYAIASSLATSNGTSGKLFRARTHFVAGGLPTTLSEKTFTDIEAGIDSGEVVKLTQDLVRIPSVYTNEAEIAQFVFDKFVGWGLKPRKVIVPGHGPDVVVSHGSSKRPSMIFNGHMDTVDVMQGWKHDPFGAKIEKGMLYGLGSLDMKSGLAALMVAFRVLVETGAVEGSRLMFQAVSGEESTGGGTRRLIDIGAFERAKAVIVGEGIGGPSLVTNGRRGGSYYDFEVLGKAAHGAEPERGINAVVDASRAITAVSEMKVRKSRSLVGDDLKPLSDSQTVLKVSGGTDSLSVPDRCSFRLVRSTMPGSDPDIGPALRRTISGLGLKSKVKIQFMGSREHLYHPFLTPPESRLVKVASKWVSHYSGEKPRLVCGRSEADDNLIAHEVGVPVISLGPGESGKLARYHQPEEAISISRLGPAAKIYAMVAAEMVSE